MLIGLNKKFIFIASLKTASTSIEEVLRPYSEISLVESRFGKHMPFALIEDRFRWVFEFVPRGELFIFSVIRDPVDYVLSLYNSHSEDRFKTSPDLYTGEMSFDTFLSDWTVKNKGQILPQVKRFIDKTGKLAPNYVVSFANLQRGLAEISTILNVPKLPDIRNANPSPKGLDRDQLHARHLNWIQDRFREDFDFLDGWVDRDLR